MSPPKEPKYLFKPAPTTSNPIPQKPTFSKQFRDIIRKSENLAQQLEEIQEEIKTTPREMLDNLNIEYLAMGLPKTPENIRLHLTASREETTITDVEEFVIKALCERMESLGKEAFEVEDGKTVVSYMVLERQLREVTIRPWVVMVRG